MRISSSSLSIKGISSTCIVRLSCGYWSSIRWLFTCCGHLSALYQPAEFLIILGAGLGGFIVANNGKAIKATLNVLPKLSRLAISVRKI
ncbi:Motility protein A [Arsenophonus endosymbiont of Bemisia tabaci Q2]|nr:Motility protein A [Arsenophonus endosymbiont of Bemisia tabaci Q2]